MNNFLHKLVLCRFAICMKRRGTYYCRSLRLKRRALGEEIVKEKIMVKLEEIGGTLTELLMGDETSKIFVSNVK